MHKNMCEGSWSNPFFVNICTTSFEETLMWDLIYFEIYLSLIHDRFVRVLHEILHAMS